MDVNAYTYKPPRDSQPNSNRVLATPRARVPTNSTTPRKKPGVSLIGAAAYARACRSRGSLAFQLAIRNLVTVCSRSTDLVEPEMDSGQVPTKYRDFANVFSKQRAKQLPPHRPHDLTILIEDETTPPLGPIYSLSPTELLTLQEFIEENVKSGLI